VREKGGNNLSRDREGAKNKGFSYSQGSLPYGRGSVSGIVRTF